MIRTTRPNVDDGHIDDVAGRIAGFERAFLSNSARTENDPERRSLSVYVRDRIAGGYRMTTGSGWTSLQHRPVGESDWSSIVGMEVATAVDCGEPAAAALAAAQTAMRIVETKPWSDPKTLNTACSDAMEDLCIRSMAARGWIGAVSAVMRATTVFGPAGGGVMLEGNPADYESADGIALRRIDEIMRGTIEIAPGGRHVLLRPQPVNRSFASSSHMDLMRAIGRIPPDRMALLAA